MRHPQLGPLVLMLSLAKAFHGHSSVWLSHRGPQQTIVNVPWTLSVRHRPRTSADAVLAKPDSVAETSVTEGGKRRINTRVRKFMDLFQSWFDEGPQDDDGDDNGTLDSSWKKMRNYLYKSSDRITKGQIVKVLTFLQEAFPQQPQLHKHIVQTSPRILRKNVDTNLRPTLEFLQQLYGPDLLQEAVRRNPNILLTRGTGYGQNDSLDLVDCYLRQELQLSERVLKKLKQTAPFLFQQSMSKVLSTVTYLTEFLAVANNEDKESNGSSIENTERIRKALTQVVTHYPTIFQLSVEENLKPRVEFLKQVCHLTDIDICRLVQNKCALPILGLSVQDNLQPTVQLLQERLGSDKDNQSLRKVLLAHPQLLGLSLDNLQSKVAYFDEIDRRCGKILSGPSRRAGLASRMFLRAPAVYSLSLVNNIEPKITFLARIWGSNALDDQQEAQYCGGDVSALLSEDPSILTMSLEGNLRPTVNFFNRTGYIRLDSDWKLCPEGAESGKTRMILRPRYLSASLFNRLLPRWHFWLSQSPQTDASSPQTEHSKPPPLHILVQATDASFCDHFRFDHDAYRFFKRESVPRLKFSSQFDTWLKTGRPIDASLLEIQS